MKSHSQVKVKKCEFCYSTINLAETSVNDFHLCGNCESVLMKLVRFGFSPRDSVVIMRAIIKEKISCPSKPAQKDTFTVTTI